MIWPLSLGVEHFHFGRDYKIVNQHRSLTDCRDKHQLRSDRDIVISKNEESPALQVGLRLKVT